MNIFLTGADGYMGWPTALKLSKQFPGTRIVACDNLARRKWVEEIGSISAIPLPDIEKRIAKADENGFSNISFIKADLSDYAVTKDLISTYHPEVVVHTAAQPSAPYSHISAEKVIYTQENNLSMTRNLLWALRELDLVDTHFIETTTTGIYGAPSLHIPEGNITAIGKDNSQDTLPYPNMASSWYHVSKGFNATNMRLMNFQIHLPVSDLRTSIIYGITTEETRGNESLFTRFDFDFYFGTLFNRWCAMAVIGEPLTIYGTGEQIKPFIHVEDAAGSVADLIRKGNPAQYLVYNQLTEYIRIMDLASMIAGYMKSVNREVEIKKIPNPRVESEDKNYRFENEKFMELLSSEPKKMKESIGETLEILLKYADRIKKFKDRLMG